MVLHLIDHDGPGGAQQIVRALVRARNSDEAIYLRRYGEPKLSGVASFFRAWKASRHHKIIHAHLTKSLMFVLLLKILTRKTVLYHEHGKVLTGSLPYVLLLRLSTLFVDQYITVSEATSKELQRYISKKPIVLHNFVIIPQVRRKKHALTLGFMGRIHKVKGWDRFLEVVRFAKLPGVVAGTGPDEAEMKRRAKHLPIRFIGHVRPSTFYSKASIVIIPSRSESFSLVAAEASALGIPVIAHNIPAIHELRLPNCWCHDITDIAGFCRLIRRVVKQTVRKHQNTYTLEAYQKKLDALYGSFMQ
jgi:glycosyltransferase involved in cell wall biosynthesis